MKIRSVSFKNFASYGNRWQTIEFDEQQGNFYIVLGDNGAGKSSLSDAIKFGLYGRLDNKKLAHIANRFNKHAHVKIELEKNGLEQITIERGVAPNFFKLSVNGVEYQQAGKKNVQSFLEDEILGIPYYIFNNMISLSINDFKSFMDMGPSDKRNIIDRIFGLELITHMRSKVKNKIREIKDAVDELTTEINVLIRTIDNSTLELELLNTKLNESAEEKKEHLIEKIEKLELYIQNAEAHLEKLSGAESELKDAIDALNQNQTSINYETKARDGKIKLLQKGQCPTCETNLDTDYHKELLQNYLEKNEEVKEELADITTQLNELGEKRKKLLESKKEIEGKTAAANFQISNSNKELKQLSESNGNDEQTVALRNIIENSTSGKNDAIQKKDNETKRINFYGLVDEIFGDRGIKLIAIKKILPLLNSEIKKVLTALGLEYRVTFNEEFAVDIKHLGYEIAVEQLSTGERKKMDFAVLIALMRIMKMRFSGINLFFLDEIFSSIDMNGIYHILNVLHKTCRELKLNIFVINHSPLPTEIFDYRVVVQKNNGFSNLDVEKIE
jgi:exonuclease SbcC